MHAPPPRPQGFQPLSAGVLGPLGAIKVAFLQPQALQRDGAQPAARGELLKVPEPSSTLDHLNHNAWGWGLDIDWILKAPPGDCDVQPGSEASL